MATIRKTVSVAIVFLVAVTFFTIPPYGAYLAFVTALLVTMLRSFRAYSRWSIVGTYAVVCLAWWPGTLELLGVQAPTPTFLWLVVVVGLILYAPRRQDTPLNVGERDKWMLMAVVYAGLTWVLFVPLMLVSWSVVRVRDELVERRKAHQALIPPARAARGEQPASEAEWTGIENLQWDMYTDSTYEWETMGPEPPSRWDSRR